MTDNNEDMLRNSLKAVERRRNWLLAGFVATAVLLVLAFRMAAGRLHGEDGSHNMTYFLHDIFVILSIWTGMMTFVVVLQITAMTKRILRAIELAARK